ncbi:MAG: hypothetical protein NTY42_23990 [Planctomycetota bacterium]|nr:hypothetical protein [Planctomycetota bacterium]
MRFLKDATSRSPSSTKNLFYPWRPYIDLNPVAAGIVPLPEQSPHNSIKERVDNAVAQGRMEDVEQIRNI